MVGVDRFRCISNSDPYDKVQCLEIQYSWPELDGVNVFIPAKTELRPQDEKCLVKLLIENELPEVAVELDVIDLGCLHQGQTIWHFGPILLYGISSTDNPL